MLSACLFFVLVVPFPSKVCPTSFELGPLTRMKIHLFGAATPTGQALHNLAKVDLVGYSRKVSAPTSWLHPADFSYPAAFHPAGQASTPAVWISFAPIWLFASFLDVLAVQHPERLLGLRGVIACSSSSVITKCFASNRFDRRLVARLAFAEEQLLAMQAAFASLLHFAPHPDLWTGRSLRRPQSQPLASPTQAFSLSTATR